MNQHELSRRNFIKITTAATIGSGLGAITLAGCSSHRKLNEIGLQVRTISG